MPATVTLLRELKFASPLTLWSSGTVTDNDGNWTFILLLGDPEGWYAVTISSPTGTTTPGSYNVKKGGENQSGMDFAVLPKLWEFTINGEEVDRQNNPASPHQLCDNNDNCLNLNVVCNQI